ncbi:MAG: hypothetical protein ACRELB_10015, partial [Polyangiaceae bacterium]
PTGASGEASQPASAAPAFYAQGRNSSSVYSAQWRWWLDFEGQACLTDLPQAAPASPNFNICNSVGRLWWFVPQRADAPAILPDSVYTVLELDQYSSSPHILPLGATEISALIDNSCAACSAASSVVSVISDPGDPGVVIEVAPPGGPAVDISDEFSRATRVALNEPGSTLLSAAEPAWQVAAGDPAAVVLGAGNTLVQELRRDPASGSFYVSRAPGLTADPPEGADIALALSGRGHALMAAGVSSGDSIGSVWTNDLATGQWARVPIDGPAPGRALSMTATRSEALGTLPSAGGVFYLLDLVPNCGPERVRLLRVEPGGKTTSLGTWPRRGDTRYFVGASYDGGLLLSCADHDHHEFVLAAADGVGIKKKERLSEDGDVLLPPRAMRNGILWAQADRDKAGRNDHDAPGAPTTHLASYASFRSVPAKQPRWGASCF